LQKSYDKNIFKGLHYAAPPYLRLSIRHNTIVSLINESIEDFNSITAEPSRWLCFIGNNSYQEGQICGEKNDNYLNGRGQVAIILPGFQFANHNIDMEETQAN